jgi:hypothetical protein
MPFRYQSGEEIKKADRVTFHGEPGEIESIADPLTPSVDTEWYIQQLGGGVMVLEPKHFGRAFVSKPEEAEDLVLMSRG